ncbi:MAG: S41 family peptidase [Magnetovibrio sp.]|nr:S41 family peptidase [Magnetovibrio sp.]
MGYEFKNLGRSCVQTGLSLALCAGVVACAPNQAQAPLETISNQQQPEVSLDTIDEALDPTIRSTIRAGLTGIQRRYIDPVYIDDLSINAIQGLATIDPSLSVSEADNKIILLKNGNTIASAPRPLNQSPDQWATITAQMILVAQTRSEDFKDIEREQMFEAVFDGMLSGLDIYSRYAGAVEANANRARRDGFGGIDIRFNKTTNKITITHVQEGGPAQNAGLKVGDVISKINAQDVKKLSLRKVAKILRGPVGSTLTVEVERRDEEMGQPTRTISFLIERAHVVHQTVHTGLQNDVLTLTVTSFNKKTAQNIRAVLNQHEQGLLSGDIRGIILDLRGNPGGLLSQSVNVADLFLRDGRIIATRGRHPDSFHDYHAGGDDITENAPLVVLVDGGSASAAELVASALQDLKRAVVVGSTSYGKGTVQTVLRLPNDGEITLTWSRLVTPSGYAIHGLGVQPSVCTNRKTPLTTAKTLLNPMRIQTQHEVIQAWRGAGLIFDGRRAKLRESCPSKTFNPNFGQDIWKQLASRILNDQNLYQYALGRSESTDTALRP